MTSTLWPRFWSFHVRPVRYLPQSSLGTNLRRNRIIKMCSNVFMVRPQPVPYKNRPNFFWRSVIITSLLDAKPFKDSKLDFACYLYIGLTSLWHPMSCMLDPYKFILGNLSKIEVECTWSAPWCTLAFCHNEGTHSQLASFLPQSMCFFFWNRPIAVAHTLLDHCRKF